MTLGNIVDFSDLGALPVGDGRDTARLPVLPGMCLARGVLSHYLLVLEKQVRNLDFPPDPVGCRDQVASVPLDLGNCVAQ